MAEHLWAIAAGFLFCLPACTLMVLAGYMMTAGIQGIQKGN